MLLAIFVLKRKRRLGRKETVLARKKRERYDDEFDPTNHSYISKILRYYFIRPKIFQKNSEKKKRKEKKKDNERGEKRENK